MSKKWSVQKLVLTAMLAAVAGVLMSFEFPLPLMPPFYKVDFSDIPPVVALFTMGPASAAGVEVIKILIKLILKGTSTNFVGELANLVGIVLFIVPIWLLYVSCGRTRKAAARSLMISLPVRIVFSCCVNAFITLPLYAASQGIAMSDVIAWVSTVNPAIKNLPTFLILATVPFNFIKLFVNYLAGYILYSRLSNIESLNPGVKNSQFRDRGSFHA